MIIDAHQHFWDLSTGDYPWMAGETMQPLRRNFGPDDLIPLMADLAIDKTITVQCRHDPAETRDMLDIAARHDFVAGVVGWVDLQADDVAGEIARLRDLPGGKTLVGIRHNAHDEQDADWLNRQAVHRGVAAVIDAGLTFDLLVRSRELPAAIDLVKTFPQGRFVLDHMAKPPIASGQTDEWKSRFERIAAFGNVWCKVSGLVSEADSQNWNPTTFDPYTQMALDLFGQHRIIFGSDWPVCTTAATYRDVFQIARRLIEANPGIAEHFFHHNAAAAYRLGDSSTGNPQ